MNHYKNTTGDFYQSSFFGLALATNELWYVLYSLLRTTNGINPFRSHPLCRVLAAPYPPLAQLDAKKINGRYLTAPELRNYASAYVELFHKGADFPAARSLLEATAGAHNGNAKHVAMLKYKVVQWEGVGIGSILTTA